MGESERDLVKVDETWRAAIGTMGNRFAQETESEGV